MEFVVKRQDASPKDRTRSSTFECMRIAYDHPRCLPILPDGKFSLQTSAYLCRSNVSNASKMEF
ncbi:Uncharacterized protein BM_BM17869 [Brugia malayi]|uniref:Uncharacterized protein n=1 Tax=Brugia malayi TaxID=6279 RepID=A0A4E9EPE2_BRUMA|nr:Uncharacterized protein BM_BM17869 [Brugia malayi]VIO85770.1 Uncharacterized protein BM_BM17869 [Brugia malayi]